MKRYSNKLIIERVQASELTTRELAEKTKPFSSDGKGLSHTTAARMLRPDYDPKVSYVEIISHTLGISPRSNFIETEGTEESEG